MKWRSQNNPGPTYFATRERKERKNHILGKRIHGRRGLVRSQGGKRDEK